MALFPRAYPSRVRACVVAALLAAMPVAANAQMFWRSPDFSGAPVSGADDGIGVVEVLPGATQAEQSANLLWALRAGLNVAALQCQFSPALLTVDQYNDVIRHHAKELTAAYTTLAAYFKRVGGATAQTALDQYTTRTYNSFSTLHGQFGFCQVASRIGYDALTRPQGQLLPLARGRMREFRNALRPAGDLLFTSVVGGLPRPYSPAIDPYEAECYDKKGNVRKKCRRG